MLFWSVYLEFFLLILFLTDPFHSLYSICGLDQKWDCLLRNHFCLSSLCQQNQLLHGRWLRIRSSDTLQQGLWSHPFSHGQISHMTFFQLQLSEIGLETTFILDRLMAADVERLIQEAGDFQMEAVKHRCTVSNLDCSVCPTWNLRVASGFETHNPNSCLGRSVLLFYIGFVGNSYGNKKSKGVTLPIHFTIDNIIRG